MIVMKPELKRHSGQLRFFGEAGVTTRVIRMEPYKDPDEFIKNLGAEAFEERIRKARNSFMFGLEMLEKVMI